MNKIKIQGVYTPGVHNFFVDSIAKYVRDNNYPEWYAQECEIITSDGKVFNYLISRNDTLLASFKIFIEIRGDEVHESSGVIYKVDGRDFSMNIDGHFYWATV